MGDSVEVYIGRLLCVFQSFPVTDTLVQFGEEFETRRCFGVPGFDRFDREVIVKGRIQLDAIELRRIICQFVFGAFGIKPF
ncbi:hypothetical protein D3C87_1690080 [compost metagenome]